MKTLSLVLVVLVLCCIHVGTGQPDGGANEVTDCCRHDQEHDRSCGPCPIVFGFYTRALTALERGEHYSVRVGFLSGTLNRTIEFDVQLNLGTARSSDVQLLGSSHIKLYPEEISHEVGLTLRVDGVAQEANETFSLTISDLDASAFDQNSTNILSMNGTIQDSDSVLFQFSEDDFGIKEGLNATIPVGIAKHHKVRLANPVTLRVTPLTVEAALSRGIIQSFPAEELTSPDRANAADFDESVVLITFPADEDEELAINAIVAEIPITDDHKDENLNQYFIGFLEVVAATNPKWDNNFKNVTVCTIFDNDEECAIGFPEAEYLFHEPETPTAILNVTLVKENGCVTERTFSVGISISEASTNTVAAALINTHATGGRSFDFSFEGQGRYFTLTFPPHNQNVAINFTLNSDDLPERLEGFQLSLTAVQGSPNFMLPRTNSTHSATEIQITDDDYAVVGFRDPSYTFSEQNGLQSVVCIQIFNPPRHEELVFNITVHYWAILRTADGNDFFLKENSTSFFAGPGSPNTERLNCFRVNIIDDTHHEGMETFTLTSVHEEQSRVHLQPNVTEITILSDDDAVVGFEHSEYTVSESDGSLQVCVRVFNPPDNRELTIDIPLDYFTSVGTADEMDFTSVTNWMKFLAGLGSHTMRKRCFSIQITDDNVPEEQESFTLNLNFNQSLQRFDVRITPDRATIFIDNNDDEITTADDNVPSTTQEPNQLCTESCIIIIVVLCGFVGIVIGIIIVCIVSYKCCKKK